MPPEKGFNPLKPPQNTFLGSVWTLRVLLQKKTPGPHRQVESQVFHAPSGPARALLRKIPLQWPSGEENAKGGSGEVEKFQKDVCQKNHVFSRACPPKKMKISKVFLMFCFFTGRSMVCRYLVFLEELEMIYKWIDD